MSQQVSVSFLGQKQKAMIQNKSIVRLLLISMRPHQWTKNLFIFTPLLFGKKLGDPIAIGQSLFAFAIFCLVSSGLYIFNDVIDMKEDRAHPEKCNRPISSGALPRTVAISASAIFIIIALSLAALFSLKFLFVVGLYFLLTLSYCLTLKQVIVLDGMIIASGFVLRVVGGAVTIGVTPTHWLIVCAFLLALFLAFTKRRQELLSLEKAATSHRHVLGEYSVAYLDQVNNILIGSTIVCYALYTVAPETIERFGTDSLIYGTVFVMYGLLRYMILIRHPSNGGNPSKMLLHDRPLQLAVFGWVVYNAIVIYQTAFVSIWKSFS